MYLLLLETNFNKWSRQPSSILQLSLSCSLLLPNILMYILDHLETKQTYKVMLHLSVHNIHEEKKAGEEKEGVAFTHFLLLPHEHTFTSENSPTKTKTTQNPGKNSHDHIRVFYTLILSQK